MHQPFFRFNVRTVLLGVFLSSGAAFAAAANALEDYVQKPDSQFEWRKQEERQMQGMTATRLSLVSQQWRDTAWSHNLLVVRPKSPRNGHIGFLLVTGDNDVSKYFDLLKTMAESGGAIAAVVNKVPNQPLYDGRREDALIAYTFDQYLRTGDESWPLLFPMVKSAVRAMDAVQAFAREEYQQELQEFVVSGASKRGWTTWLSAAVDARVKGIAPMVIDMLNMKAQLHWAEQAYGRQSEKISDYTELNLIDRIDDPAMVRLRQWIDPYSYRHRYTMPKLLLLGTNDPYWVVDSLRHYWPDLPAPKLVYQTPNAGHDLAGGKQAARTVAAWFQMLADRQPLPELKWKFPEAGKASIAVEWDRPAKSVRLWTSDSADRDFRDDSWSSRDLKVTGQRKTEVEVPAPAQGYRAYLVEVEIAAATGPSFKLSTEARVTPERMPEPPVVPSK